MMAKLILVVSLLSLIDPVFSRRACAEAPASCSSLPQSVTASCLSLFSQLKVCTYTCTTPSSTYTVTKTSQPITTITAVSTSVRTVKVTDKTGTSLVVNLLGVQTVVGDWQYTEVTVDGTTTISRTQYVDQKSYYPRESCLVQSFEKRIQPIASVPPLPSDCSCILTSTTTSGVTSTTSTQTNLPSAVTRLSIEKSTITESYAANTQTTDVVSTTTITEVYTGSVIAHTERSTTTSILTGEECDSAIEYRQNYGPLDLNNREVKGRYDIVDKPNTNYADCCRICHTTLDCSAWSTDPTQKNCKLYINNYTYRDLCPTRMCPHGLPILLVTSRNGDYWGWAQCMGGMIKK